MRFKDFLIPLAVTALTLLLPVSAICNEPDDSAEIRGKYLVEIGGCNDCHTAGFAASGANIPEDQWLLGDALGYRGPWGTTYPSNLRVYFSQISEDEWVETAKVFRARPPMPWWALNALNESDSRALYRYISSLDVVASEVPAYVPPTQEPNPPYVQFPSPPEEKTLLKGKHDA